MSPPRAPRTSRFADEAVATVGKPKHSERTWRPRDERITEELLLEQMRADQSSHRAETPTDAVSAVEVIGGEWTARWVLARQDGAYTVRSLTLEPNSPTTPPGGITTNLLRELSPQRALSTFLRDIPEAFLDYVSPQTTFRSEPPGTGTPRTAGGRPRVSDEELAAVAQAYLRELQSGDSGITTRIRKSLGYAKDSLVRDRVRMCRERGWLSPTHQGRRGGEAGPKLIGWQQGQETGR